MPPMEKALFHLRTLSVLPLAARNYLDRIAELAGFPTRLVNL
jgi:adenylosuccinate synthase